MKVIKPQHLLMLTAPIKFGRQSQLGLTVGYGFRLSDPRILVHEVAIWTAMEQSPLSFQLLDAAAPKPFAEFLLGGHAFAEFPAASVGDQVFWTADIQVSDVQKSVRCEAKAQAAGKEGQSTWSKLSLDHVNAYGGPNCPDNTVGRGFDSNHSISDQAGKEQPLLLLQNDDGVHADPLAAFGPIDMRWRQRYQFLPQEKGLLAPESDDREHPGWPLGMDRRFFQMAPPNQWYSGEQWPLGFRYRLAGMSPKGGELAGSAPVLRAHIAVRRKNETDYQAIPLQLKTIWIFPDHDLGVALHTGFTDIDDILSEEIESAIASLSKPDKPIETSELGKIAARRRDLSRAGIDSLRDDELMPDSAEGWVREYILTPEDHPRLSPAPRTYEEIKQRMQEYNRNIEAATESTSKIAGFTQNAPNRASFAKNIKRATETGKLPPVDSTIDWRQRLQVPSAQRHANQLIQDADLSGYVLSGHIWNSVFFIRCNLGGTRWENCKFENTNFIDCNLEQSNWSDCSFKTSRFSQCEISHSTWENTQADLLQLEDSSLAHASIRGGLWKTSAFVECRAAGLLQEKVRWDGCQFQDSDLSGLKVNHCGHASSAFVNCQLDQASSTETLWDKASWIECSWKNARIEGSRFFSSIFSLGCDLSQSDWHETQLEKTYFGEVIFSGSMVRKCSWSEAILKDLQASGSQWHTSDMSNANLMHADLSEATFSACSLKNANLYGTDLRGSEIRHCNLINANLGYAWRDENNEKARWTENLLSRLIELPRRRA